MKDYDKAIADYDQAIRMAQRPNFFTNRGDSYQFKGELGTALADYDTALRLDPNFAQAYNNRAVLYKKMGDRAKALADYEAALRLDPGNENAADGRRTMKAEIARFGNEPPRPLTAPDTHPSFDCDDGQARGGEGDLRRSAAWRARSPDRRRLCPAWSTTRAAVPPMRCAVPSAISSQPAMPASASPATTFAWPCNSASMRCSPRRTSRRPQAFPA